MLQNQVLSMSKTEALRQQRLTAKKAIKDAWGVSICLDKIKILEFYNDNLFAFRVGGVQDCIYCEGEIVTVENYADVW